MADSPGNFEPHFWENVVLQFSHRYTAVKQSLVALSAIYEEYGRNQSSENPGAVQYSDLTIQRYNKAVRELVKYLATGEQNTTVALISCLIFVVRTGPPPNITSMLPRICLKLIIWHF
ncbi:hypothetical protein ONS96_001251 [Cadophora gregata f. sp. sojae]|nr:hypothetical protein ONS96_001251 [Cadophora gregata f. sp. sojae]